MTHQFEPLQNDLIIRTAWGKVLLSSTNNGLKKIKVLINLCRPDGGKGTNVGYRPLLLGGALLNIP
jgi:hypothetical protein